MKKIFTPFPSAIAGNLSSVLKASSEGDKGFQPSEYVFAPSGESTSKPLANLLKDTDQLYINGHCNKGLDYLSTSAVCAHGDRVSVDDVVGHLKTLGFPPESRAKVKLWACKGGLDGDAGQPSFAKVFSKAMFKAGYQSCQIFGYDQFLMQKYMSGSDNQIHKRSATQPASGATEEERLLDYFLEDLYDPDLDSRQAVTQRKTWERMVAAQKGTGAEKVAAAKQAILNSPMKTAWRPKGVSATGIVGPRAKESRKEFRDGVVVNHT
ncbi:hypothetical protein [Variovorax sp. JS1663]|uniref:hypothetical protein n=1 Tax=Variovorax sp. JS1663 TaxID=1851577 RepID=UPI000B7160FA|nr:hypothetical protein [Variovorax sp. JS1663]OUL98332.1 hypothetical protein A8M77_32045 [Variovorax sp. JS1663]